MLELRRTGHLTVLHHAVLAMTHKHLQTLVTLPSSLDPHHLQVDQLLRHLRLQVRRLHEDRHLLPRLTLSGHLAMEHLSPVPSIRWQPECLIQTHVVQDQHTVLPFRHAHTTTHLLQILAQTQRRTSQLYKLHLRTVKPLTENIHIHQNVYLVEAIGLDKIRTFFLRCFRINDRTSHALTLIIPRNMLRMRPVDRIHDSLLP